MPGRLDPDTPHAISRIPFNVGAAMLWPFWAVAHRVREALWVPVPIVVFLLVKSFVIRPLNIFVDIPTWLLSFFGSGIVWSILIAVPSLAFGVYADDLVWRRDSETLDRTKYVTSQRWWAAGTLAYFILTSVIRLP